MNLIFQYWNGEVPRQAQYSASRMKEYADEIGVDHLFYDNPKFDLIERDLGLFTPHFACFIPIYDESFDKYDDIAFIDADVFPVDGLTDNIFDDFNGEIGIVPESFTTEQPFSYHNPEWEMWRRFLADNYDTDIPLRNNGDVRVLNSGVVLYSKEARIKARSVWMDFKEYYEVMMRNNMPRFFACDQTYLHFMIYKHDFDVQFLDDKWNSQIIDFWSRGYHVKDIRKPDTKFVHVRLNNSEGLSDVIHDTIVNEPKEYWSKYLKLGQYNPRVRELYKNKDESTFLL